MNKRLTVFSRLFFSVLLLPSLGFAEEPYIARAVSVTGKVLMRSEGGTNVQMSLLKPGDRLYKGAIVNTGSDGAVKLLMTDRTILDLGPSSLFKMNDYELANVGDRKVDVSLDYGQVRASVNEKLTSNKGKFTVRTKTATMGVRGTEFVVNAPVPENAKAQAEPKTTSLTVMHGKVEVVDALKPAAPPIAVTPGFQFAKSGDSVGQVAQLQPQEIAQVKAGAYQKDTTFLQTVSFDQNTSAGNDSKPQNQAGATQSTTNANAAKKTLETIATNVETQSKEAEKPQITDLKLPGTFTPEIPQTRPIDQLNGRIVNLKVRICPPSSPGC